MKWLSADSLNHFFFVLLVLRIPAFSGELALVPDADEYTAEVFFLLHKSFQTAAIAIRPGGIAVGVVANHALFRGVKGCKMCAEPASLFPVIEQNTDITGSCHPVKPGWVERKLHRKSPVLKTQGRTPEGGTCIAVNQGKLPFKIAYQFFNVSFVPHQSKGIVGGNPAAACCSTGTKAIAPFVLWDLPLVENQIIHGQTPQDVPACIHPEFWQPASPFWRRDVFCNILPSGDWEWGRKVDFSGFPGR